MNVGYLGGDVSMGVKQELIKKHLKPIEHRAVDKGPRGQCRCGGLKYVLWRRRWYCIVCGRWVKIFPHEQKDTPA